MAHVFHTLAHVIPVGEALVAKPPTEFRIFSFGKTDTTKGEFHFDEESAAELMQAYADYGNRLTIDYEHMALSDPPVVSPAAASFIPEVRKDGLWATDVRWTSKAAEMLSAKEYLYFSPAFTVDDKQRPNRLLNVALTNIPATKNMTPLVAAKHTETSMKTVLTALSLKESASEAEALSAVTRLHDFVRQVHTLTGKDNTAEALGALTAMKLQAEQAEKLSAQLEVVRAEKELAETNSLLDEAQKDGRFELSDRPRFEALYKEVGIKALRTCLSALRKAPAPAIPPSGDAKPPAVAVHGLTKGQLEIIKNTGLTPEKWLEHKQKLTNASSEGK